MGLLFFTCVIGIVVGAIACIADKIRGFRETRLLRKYFRKSFGSH